MVSVGNAVAYTNEPGSATRSGFPFVAIARAIPSIPVVVPSASESVSAQVESDFKYTRSPTAEVYEELKALVVGPVACPSVVGTVMRI